MNTYENAVPKPLKFLVSDGKLVDDAGNVIAESESLKDLYTKWNPEVKKYLLSDGSVVDEEGNLIVKNDYYKKVYDQADPKVAKYLHADGTIDENSGSGGADLEDNHQTTIDVSTYTEPVEVVPESGKDGMKKNTVTLDNIPELEISKTASIDVSTYAQPVEVVPTQGKDGMKKTVVVLQNIPTVRVTAYAWVETQPDGTTSGCFLPWSKTPSYNQLDQKNVMCWWSNDRETIDSGRIMGSNNTFRRVSDTVFTIEDDDDEVWTYTRGSSSKDFTIW